MKPDRRILGNIRIKIYKDGQLKKVVKENKVDRNRGTQKKGIKFESRETKYTNSFVDGL